MNSFFVFESILPRNSELDRKRAAIFFTASEALDLERLSERLTTFLGKRPPPDAVIILAPNVVRSTLESILHFEPFLERLPTITRQVPPPVLLISFDEYGGCTNPIGEIGIDSATILKDISDAGLLSIFRFRNAILSAGKLYHFEKPSGGHSDQFVRTAELVVAGAEVNFIAFCLLKYVDQSVTHIYCDTGSISVVGYAVLQLKKLFSNAFKNVTVDSFGSYEKLKETQFYGSRRALFLISASTSGGLAQEICKTKYVDPDQIVTLFYLGQPTSGSKILCDLGAIDSKDGFQPIKTYPEKDCPFCKRGSLALRIMGDHFLPKGPVINTLTPRVDQMPIWLTPALERYAGRSAIRCFVDEGNPRARRDLFVDVKKIVEAPDSFDFFHRKLNKLLVQKVPATLKRIVSLGDFASASLANFVQQYVKKTSDYEVPIVPASDLQGAPKELESNEGTVMVVASAAVTGRSLLSVSQSLRNLQKNGSIIFLVGIARVQNKSSLDELRANLTFGNFGPQDYDLATVETMFLPDPQFRHATSWEDEMVLFRKLTETGDDLIPSLEARYDVLLEAAKDSVGLSNNLFWSSPTGEPLLLRQNFAFFRSAALRKLQNVSQADLYFTIASILHHLRDCVSITEDRLIQTEHTRTLLSPRCFDRFNDGAIQAAFLRAGTVRELDYSVSEQNSYDMREVIIAIFRNWDNQSGEATLEFLFALATERLKLRKVDLQDVLNIFANPPLELPDEITFLAKYIKGQILPQQF